MNSTLFAFGFGMPGPFEMLVIAAIALLLFGNRLPGAMRSLGKSVVEFKKGVSGIEDEVNDSVNKVVDEKSSNSNGDDKA